MTRCTERPASPADGAAGAVAEAVSWFGGMIDRCLEHAETAHRQGRPVVGILCEYTPRELIMAAGAVPVCLCGGYQETIAAAERHLPANLCPLIKSTYGFWVEHANPFLEMAALVVGETTCDGKKKMLELLAAGKPTYVLELPQKAADADALAHWHAELAKLKAVLEARFRCTITPQALRDAIGRMNRERACRRRLAERMGADVPPFTGLQLLGFRSSISGLDADLAQYERLLAATAQALPPSQDGAPVRVLLTGVPVVHGAERVVRLLEDCGGLVVCMESCTGVRPLLEDVDEADADPLRALAAKYYHLPCSVLTPNDERLRQISRLAKHYRVQCVVELVWQACLTYDVESWRVRRLAEDDLGLPYLKIETDYSPSDTARLTTRIEALYERVMARP
jgi:benzoyl-CoA reductase/2-hydroxyglutaryl-CoA dehydratase subunit BcrC/BadD/HgdB